MPRKIILITGASSGIGRACATYLSARGHKVYGASRSIQQVNFSDVVALPMDVNDDTAINHAIARIIADEGRLDVVVNCAGFGLAGALEETTVDEAKAQFETNFFGVMRVCKAALPVMRKQGGGLIVNISSLAGLTAVPFQTMYSASKFALEALTEGLRMEVAEFGIRVTLIEPGDFATGFTASRQRTKAAQANSAYQAKFDRAVSQMERDETKGPAPEKITHLLEKIMNSPKPKLRYAVGRFDQTFGVALKNFLPHSWYEAIMMKTYGLK